jgi:hypothetical protein
MVESVGTFKQQTGRFRYHREWGAKVGRRGSAAGVTNQLEVTSEKLPELWEFSPSRMKVAHAQDVAVSPEGCLRNLEDAIASMDSTSKIPGTYVNSTSLLQAENQRRARDKLVNLVHRPHERAAKVLHKEVNALQIRGGAQTKHAYSH